MKFAIDSSLFKNKVLLAASAINSNPVLPILNDILIECNEEKGIVRFVGTNLSTYVSTECETKTDIGGSCTVCAERLKKWVGTLTGDVGEDIKVIYGKGKLTLICSAGSYVFPTQDGNDYPNKPKTGETNLRKASLASHDLSRMIERTVASVCNDQLRPNLTGLCLDFNDDANEVIGVATDSFIMTKSTSQLINNSVFGEIKTKVIVPKECLSLVKSESSYVEEVEFVINNKNVFFKFGATEISCRLSDYEFPDYNGIFPEDAPISVSCERKGLINALQRSSLFSNKITNALLCVFDVNAQTLFIHAEDKDFQASSVESFDINLNGVDGDDFRIGLNATNMIKQLKSLPSELVVLEMSTHTRPVIVYSYEGEEETTCLVMPNFSVQLNQDTLKKEALQNE